MKRTLSTLAVFVAFATLTGCADNVVAPSPYTGDPIIKAVAQSNQDHGVISVTFNATADAYQVRYRTIDLAKPTWHPSGWKHIDKSYTASPITFEQPTGFRYEFQTFPPIEDEPRYNDGWSRSYFADLQSETKPDPPVKPDSVRVLPHTETIVWNTPKSGGQVLNYRIRYVLKHDTTIRTSCGLGRRLYATLSDEARRTKECAPARKHPALKNGFQYKVQVRAENRSGVSEWSDDVTVIGRW